MSSVSDTPRPSIFLMSRESKEKPHHHRRSSRYESDVPLNGGVTDSIKPNTATKTTTSSNPSTPSSSSSPASIKAAVLQPTHITIMVGAQRRGKGSSLGTGSRGSELDGLVGLPLNVFKYQKHLNMPYPFVLENTYLTSKLDPNVSGTLRIKVSSPAMVDAFLIACREMCGCQCTRYEVEQSDQLHLYSAASEINIPRLQSICEEVISSRFTPKRFVAAVRIALRHGRDSMLRLCYFWFKTQGATDHDAFLRRVDMTTTEKAGK